MNKELIKTFKNPIFKENPIFIMLLGLCPVLIVTDTFDKSIGIGFAVIIVLLFTNIAISSIRKIVPNEVRIPTFIVIIATFVTIVDRLMQAFTPTLYDSLGMIISMITVNCIILGRGEAFAYKNKIIPSIMDAAGCGIGFLLAVSIIGIIREILGKGGLTITNPFNGKQLFSYYPLEEFAITFFVDKAGALLILGFTVGIFNLINEKINNKNFQHKELK